MVQYNNLKSFIELIMNIFWMYLSSYMQLWGITTSEQLVNNASEHFVFIRSDASDIEPDVSGDDISEVMECHEFPQHGAEAECLARLSYKLAKSNPDRAYAESRLLQMGYHAPRFLGARTLRSQHGIFIIAMINPNPSEPINIVCRGTDLDASIITDLEPLGPGFTPIQNYIDELLYEFEELAQQFPNRTIRVMGHSLGGALAQLITRHFLEQRTFAQYTEDSVNVGDIVPCQFPHLKNVKGLETVLFQSAGVNEEITQQASTWACLMRVLNPDFGMSLLAHVRQGDFVSRTGEYIFSNIEPEIARVYLDLRPLNKPWVALEDVLDVGGVAMISAGAPLPIFLKATHVFLTRYIINRIQVHRDTIFWDPNVQTCTELVPECYGVLTNVSSEDRLRILEVFRESLLQKMPMLHLLHTWLFQTLQPLNNEDVNALASFISSAIMVIPELVEVVRRGIDNPLSGCAVALGKFSVFNEFQRSLVSSSACLNKVRFA